MNEEQYELDEKPQETASVGVGETEPFKTRVIPEQAKQPVAPDALTSPYFASSESADLLATYAILGKIGSGGMGVVYVALDRRLGRHVAIKRLRPELRDELTVRRRFLHEAKAAAALNNVHIVHIYSIGEDAEGPYIVMEYVESALPKASSDEPPPPQTLEHYVERNGAFKLEEAISFILKIGHAMEVAHANGVIHRDLKSSNILLDASGEPKVVDFGLARLTRPDVAANLTLAGDKFISLGYGAPEQESDATLTDERADVYGLGALLYFMLTGKNPRFFRDEDLPASIRPLISKALATDRDMRYQTMASFDAALTTLLIESKSERPTIKTTWRCRWCDTVNPLNTRFCGECGWDGREQCRECGEDQQVGTLFCGVCGANTREYESASTMLRKIRNAVESKQYEWAVNCASQPMTFEPVGPGGRQMLEDIQSLGSLASKRQQRREQLRTIVTTEMAAENYERVQRIIQEFRELSPSPDAFAEELASVPSKKQARDLLKIRKAFAEQYWERGARLLDVVEAVDAEGADELDRLARLLHRHHRRLLTLLACVSSVIGFIVYLALMPAAIRLDLPGVRTLWRPAQVVSVWPLAGTALRRYVALWKVGDLDAFFREKSKKPAITRYVRVKRIPDELAWKQEAFDAQIRLVQADLAEVEKHWTDEYIRALNELREQNRVAGSFDGWKTIDQELTRFVVSQTLPSDDTVVSPLLSSTLTTFRALRDKRRAMVYRKQVAVTRTYIDELEAAVKTFTQDGKMDVAEFFSEALKVVRMDPSYLNAETQLAENDAKAPPVAMSGLASFSSGQVQLDILLKPKGRYEEQRAQADEHQTKAIAQWQSDYLVALNELCGERQREGDFIGLQAASAEIGRFELDWALPSQGVLSDSVELDQLREKFRDIRSAIDDMLAQDIVAATDEYDAALVALSTQLTKEGALDLASLAVTERRQLAVRPDVIEARNWLSAKGKALSVK